MTGQREYRIDFQPIGRRGTAVAGDSILAVAQKAGVGLASLCGGIGGCDSCKVRLVAGQATEPSLVEEAIFSAEELANGWRLACQVEPLDDLKVDIPPESLTAPQRLQIEGQAIEIEPEPAVRPVDLQLQPASLDDLRADADRLTGALLERGLPPLAVSLPVLAQLSTQLRRHEWAVRLAVRDGREIVGVLPVGTPLLGLAVDIGTTSIAAYLVDLATGKVLNKTGAMNPQIAYGEDVISRIHYINEHPGGKEALQARIVATLNQLVEDMCAGADVQREQIVDAVVVGNSAMHHIFAGLPVRQLGEAPYVLALGGEIAFQAGALGLRLAPGAYIYMPPNIAGYVGTDHVAVLVATKVWQMPHTSMAVDIGTNTEVTLVHQGHCYSCSCASGPAFEGAHITFGMRAAPGAVERLQIVDGRLRLQTIGGEKPVGLCGSGILDAIAVMKQSDLINRRGALRPDHPLASPGASGQAEFVVAPAESSGTGRTITLSRKDVAEVQLAKAAIRAGIEILLQQAGISADEIEEFVIAGAFGTYINVTSAISVGMFPELPLERFRQVGNAAGMGARLLLISQPLRHDAARRVESISYVELTTCKPFKGEFIRQIPF